MPTKIRPRALQAGDTIRVVTPASPVAKEKLEKGLPFFVGPGYNFDFGASAFAEGDYLAGSDEERAADIMDAFRDPSVSAVLCSRGGYGCARLLEHLDLDEMAESGKMFLGFSDITTLHLALNKRGLVTFHSPMPLTLSTQREDWVYRSLHQAIAGGNPIPDEAPGGKTMVGGVAEGDLVGGCLCLLTDSIGTPNALDYAGKILLIEDVDESPHRIDAMLTAMLNSGVIDNVAGILFGEVTRCTQRDTEGIGERHWRLIVEERLSRLGVPIITDFPFGHALNMLTLPLGVKVRMDADAGTVQYLEAPCA